jgi:hypothetical protein
MRPSVQGQSGKAVSEQGERLNIRKETLSEWRRDFIDGFQTADDDPHHQECRCSPAVAGHDAEIITALAGAGVLKQRFHFSSHPPPSAL